MKSSNEKPGQVEGLWIDQCLLKNEQKNKQNMTFFQNITKYQGLDQNKQQVTRDFNLQIPFAQRFKGKLFTFNKVGIISKLEQLQPCSMKGILLYNKIKLSGNSCTKSIMRNRKNFVKINKTKVSSRQSIQTKHTHRQTKSLDASKVSSGSGSNRYRYASNYSEIKEQQLEETIIKKSTQSKTIYQSLNHNKENVKKQLQFQTLDDDLEAQNPKIFVRKNINNIYRQKAVTQSVPLTPNFTSLNNSRNVLDNQQQNSQFPKLKLYPKQYLSKRHNKLVEKNYIGQARGLPKIHFSRHNQIEKNQKERLLTIR